MFLEYCGTCGVRNSDDGSFCGNCGTNLRSESIPDDNDQINEVVSDSDRQKNQPSSGYSPVNQQNLMTSSQRYNYPQPHSPGITNYQQNEVFIASRNYNLIFLGTLFIPGLAYYYTNEKNSSYLITLIIYISYILGFIGLGLEFLTILAHLYFLVTSISKIKNFDKTNPKSVQDMK